MAAFTMIVFHGLLKTRTEFRQVQKDMNVNDFFTVNHAKFLEAQLEVMIDEAKEVVDGIKSDVHFAKKDADEITRDIEVVTRTALYMLVRVNCVAGTT